MSLAVRTNTLAALTGSASGWLTNALDAPASTYLARAAEVGMDPALLHRLAVIGSGTRRWPAIGDSGWRGILVQGLLTALALVLYLFSTSADREADLSDPGALKQGFTRALSPEEFAQRSRLRGLGAGRRDSRTSPRGRQPPRVQALSTFSLPTCWQVLDRSGLARKQIEAFGRKWKLLEALSGSSRKSLEIF